MPTVEYEILNDLFILASENLPKGYSFYLLEGRSKGKRWFFTGYWTVSKRSVVQADGAWPREALEKLMVELKAFSGESYGNIRIS